MDDPLIKEITNGFLGPESIPFSTNPMTMEIISIVNLKTFVANFYLSIPSIATIFVSIFIALQLRVIKFYDYFELSIRIFFHECDLKMNLFEI